MAKIFRGATGARDGDSEEADGAAAHDGDALAGDGAGEHGVDCVAEGIEERTEVAGDLGTELPDIARGDGGEVGEGAVGVDAEDFDELADVGLAAAALQAVAAGHVHFGGDEVADSEALDALADGGDGSAETRGRGCRAA